MFFNAFCSMASFHYYYHFFSSSLLFQRKTGKPTEPREKKIGVFNVIEISKSAFSCSIKINIFRSYKRYSIVALRLRLWYAACDYALKNYAIRTRLCGLDPKNLSLEILHVFLLYILKLHYADNDQRARCAHCAVDSISLSRSPPIPRKKNPFFTSFAFLCQFVRMVECLSLVFFFTRKRQIYITYILRVNVHRSWTPAPNSQVRTKINSLICDQVRSRITTRWNGRNRNEEKTAEAAATFHWNICVHCTLAKCSIVYILFESINIASMML